jgi:cytochrome c oxidase assembly protein subunit 15
MSDPTQPTGSWPRVLAWVTVFATVPLLLIGGAVTTLRVGMAVPDWPETFEHNMFLYPLSEMMQNVGVFWEHSHRLWASGVGFLVVLTALATWFSKHSARTKLLALVALLAVSGQGVLGGMRVLENSQHLAFLHGSIAQLVFAVFVMLAVVLSRTWNAVEPRACKRTPKLRRWSLISVGLVYGQIVVGAWLRHSGVMVALAIHSLLVVAVIVAVQRTIGALRESYEDGMQGGHDRVMFQKLARRLWLLLWSQILLGVVTVAAVFMFSGGFNESPSQLEQVVATLHVALGALLFVTTVTAAMWAHKLVTLGERQPAPVPAAEAVA